MAPTFKISFPLPGFRPNSSSNTTPGSLSSNRSEYDGSPMAYPGSKAERILGGAELDIGDTKRKQSRKEKKSLRKYPSFMSVTLADEDSEPFKQEEGFPFPGMKIPSEAHQQNEQILQRQGSSPLLGDPLPARPSTYTDGFSTSSSPKARRADSSSTLRSYYDKSKSPLLISQQTSSSSSRDLALRKGLPQISCHSSRDVSAFSQPATPSGLAHVRNASKESKGSEDSRLSARSKIDRIPRRRPSVTDPPTLYPNTPRPFRMAVSPPPALTNSSHPTFNSATPPQPKSFNRPKWWYRSRTERASSAPQGNMDNNLDMDGPDQRHSSIKVNVRKPKAGARNWFDGFDEDEGPIETFDEPTPVHQEHDCPQPENPLESLTISEILAQKPRSQPIEQKKSSFSSRSGPSDRKLSFRVDSPSPTRTARVFSSAPPSRNSNARISSFGGKSVHSTDSYPIIVGQSFLNLSSSDDEEDGAKIPSRESSFRGHHIRASVEKADFGDDILLGNAQRAQQARPRSIVNKQHRRSFSRRSTSPEYVPPVPQIPSRPHLSPRESSLRFRDMVESRSATTTDAESGSNNADTPLTTPISARNSSLLYRKKTTSRGSKLMKVTSEEEKLLEAMREKRASIRATDYQKGFNKALSLQATHDPSIPRPQTAGADGRHSSQRTSSLYSPHLSKQNSQDSVYPALPMLTPARYSGHRGKPSLASLGAGNRMSWSTDNLFLQEEREADAYDTASYPFPSVPETQRSDLEPTTPSTGNLPLTPPPTMPGHGMTFAMARGPKKGAPSALAGREGPGHDRKRTSSSGVVMLDGVEVAARMADEEREIVGWALDSY